MTTLGHQPRVWAGAMGTPGGAEASQLLEAVWMGWNSGKDGRRTGSMHAQANRCLLLGDSAFAPSAAEATIGVKLQERHHTTQA